MLLNRVLNVIRKKEAPLLDLPKPACLSEEHVNSWNEGGYIAIRNFFPKERMAALKAHIDKLWQDRNRKDNPLVIDIFIGTPKEQRVYFRSAPDEARKAPYKLNDLFLESNLVRDTVLDPNLADILRYLLSADPVVCNSLTFEHGSQQRFHFDTFYMPSPTPNKMLATWVAIDPVTAENGPLRYYPGSHKIPPYVFSHGRLNAIPAEFQQFDKYINDKLEEFNLKPIEFYADPGDLFIWHAQLYHGGAPIINSEMTRTSLVTHYFSTIDFALGSVNSVGRGRHFLKRGHQSAAEYK